MNIDPCEAGSASEKKAVEGARRPIAFLLAVLVSFLVCLPPGFVMAWAWWKYWQLQSVSGGVPASVPYHAFAWNVTILTSVCWVSIGFVWLVVLLRRRGRRR